MSEKLSEIRNLNQSLRGMSPSSIRLLNRVAKMLSTTEHQRWFVAFDTLIKRGPSIIEMFGKKPPASLVQVAVSMIPFVSAAEQSLDLKNVVEFRNSDQANFVIQVHQSVRVNLADLVISDLPPTVLITVGVGKEVGVSDLQEFSGSENDMHLTLYHAIAYLGANIEGRKRNHYFFLRNSKGKTVILKSRLFEYDTHSTAIITLHDSLGFRFEKGSCVVIKAEDSDKKIAQNDQASSAIKAESHIH